MALLDAGVTSFQISLDGPERTHNLTRRLAGGSGSYDVIWKNLQDIAACSRASVPFRIDLRLHYDKDSAKDLEELATLIGKELLPSGRFAVNFHMIEHLGGANDSRFALATSQEHEFVRQLARQLDALLPSELKAEVAEDVQNYVCYASKANAFVLRADGRLGKCTVALNDSRNDIGQLNLDGTISVHNERHLPWLRGIFSDDPGTLACPLHDMNVQQPVVHPLQFIREVTGSAESHAIVRQ